MTKRQILAKVENMAWSGMNASPEMKEKILNRIYGWCQGVRDEMRGNGKH